MTLKVSRSNTLPIAQLRATGLPLWSPGIFVMEEKEIWKDVVSYEGIYKVSNVGNVKSCRRLIFKNGGSFYSKEILMKSTKSKCGYLIVQLRKNNSYKAWATHRLVSFAFLPNNNNKPFVNHIDGNKENNYVSNLEWCTQSENMKHAFSTGLNSRIGIKNNSVVLNESQVLEIRDLYKKGERPYLYEIAEKYGVCKQLISRIIRRQNWTHI